MRYLVLFLPQRIILGPRIVKEYLSQGHQATVTAVGVLSDSRRVVSSDRQGVLTVWLADNATLLHSALGPTNYLQITNNMKYAVSGDGDNR